MVAQVEERRRDFPDIISRLIRIEEKLDKLNGRTRSLEIWKGFMTGGLAVIALIMAASPFLIGHFVNGR